MWSGSCGSSVHAITFPICSELIQFDYAVIATQLHVIRTTRPKYASLNALHRLLKHQCNRNCYGRGSIIPGKSFEIFEN